MRPRIEGFSVFYPYLSENSSPGIQSIHGIVLQGHVGERCACTFDIVRTTADCLQEGRIQHDLNPYKNGCAAEMKPLSPRISGAAKSQAFHEQCA